MTKFSKNNKVGKGRPKGSQNKTTILFTGLMEQDKIAIYQKAVERAKAGSDQILAKLLDKMLPTLAHNTNENRDRTFEDYLKELKLKQNESRKKEKPSPPVLPRPKR